jgi:chitin synthase
LVDVTGAVNSAGVNFQTLTVASSGQDITNLFTRQLSDYPACMGRTGLYATTPICNSTTTTINKTPSTIGSNCVLHSPTSGTLASLGMKNTSRLVGYTWDQVAGLSGYMVINGVVLNMQPYLDANPKPVTTDTVDTIIRYALSDTTSSGKDVTRMFLRSSTSLAAINCMHQRYIAGRIDKVAPGCFFSGLFLYASLIVILGVVFTRFIMAVVFNWFLSARLCRPPSESELRRKGISPSVMPEGANVSIDNGTGTAPWASGGKNGKGNKIRRAGPSIPTKDYSGSQFGEKQIGRGMNVNQSAEPLINLSQIGAELFAVCLVTCYSEGEVSIRSTLESIANTSYSDSRKLLFIVCDGMITGEGEKISTPDVCVGMLDADPRFGEPMPMGYIAVGNGAKRENRAMVYAGHYGECRTVVMILVSLLKPIRPCSLTSG